MNKEIKLNIYNSITLILGLIFISTLGSPVYGIFTLSDIMFGVDGTQEYSMLCLLSFIIFMAGVVFSVINRFDISLLSFAVSTILVMIISGNIGNNHNIDILFSWYLGGGTSLGWSVFSIHGTCSLIGVIVSIIKKSKNKSGST